MSIRSIATVLFVLSALPVPSLHAQTAAYVVRLGTDTVSVERFTRSRGAIEGLRVTRAPRTSVLRWTATLDSAGRISQYEANSRFGNALDQPPAQASRIVFGTDSATVTLTAGDSTRSYTVGAARGAVPGANLVYGLYDQVARQVVASGADSVTIVQVFPGALNPVQTFAKRVGRDSLVIGFFGDPIDARIDRQGGLLGLSGARTTQKFTVTRQANADIDAIARRFAATESAGGSPGQLSPRDTVDATIAGATIVVDYGRPRKRGREIFGGIVPFDQVWRTGANAATGITTDRELVMNGTVIPAGSYTLWTLPTRTGTTLILNRQTGQWGTDYDPAQDFARVRLTGRQLDTPVEEFTIAVEPVGDRNGRIRFAWDATEWEARFAVR